MNVENNAQTMNVDVAYVTGALKTAYDVIVCGAGSSGSVVARRLAENPGIQVLLLEAGGSDEVPSVMEAARWAENLGGPTDWSFAAEPSPDLNGRSLPMSVGKVLGGGSSINVMIWSRGHRNDWDHFAEEAGDPAWSYTSILDIHRRIEDWRGRPDPRRGVGGLLAVEQFPDPHPAARAMVDAATSLGIPAFDSPNGAMMEAEQGCALSDIRVKDGRRLSVFDTYVRPVLDRPNLTVLTEALVHRVIFAGRRAAGVEVVLQGQLHRIDAVQQVVLSAGAINTPRMLMHSGIGDGEELKRLGIPLVQHLPGVGRNLQDHTCFCTVWQYGEPIAPRGNGSGAILYGKSDSGAISPDILMCQAEFPYCSPEAARRGLPSHGWSMVAGLAQPKSRGRVQLRSSSPHDPPTITTNALSHPDDMTVARVAVELSREIGAAKAFAGVSVREAIPGRLDAAEMDGFIRDSAMPFFHLSCTARMGRDPLSVVSGDLKVYGVSNLTIADASVMPRITSGNTMASCVIIGERAAEILLQELS
jgi:choline dehydrogenase